MEAMKKLLIAVVVLVLLAGGIGLWRGWFTVTQEGKLNIHADPVKFKQDRDALGKSIGEKAKAMKVRIADLVKKSEGLKGEDKVRVEQELAQLQKKHDLLEQQIKEIAASGQDTFGMLERELTENHDAVEKLIEELTKKLEKGKAK